MSHNQRNLAFKKLFWAPRPIHVLETYVETLETLETWHQECGQTLYSLGDHHRRTTTKLFWTLSWPPVSHDPWPTCPPYPPDNYDPPPVSSLCIRKMSVNSILFRILWQVAGNTWEKKFYFIFNMSLQFNI